MSVKRGKPTHRWTTAGVAMVILAVLLAGFGLYFAINHAWMNYEWRIDRLRDVAVDARERVNHRIMDAAGRVLVRVADAWRAGSLELDAASDDCGSWIPSAYIWDGARLTGVSINAARDGEPGDDESTRSLVAEHLQRFHSGFAPGFSPGVRFVRDDADRVPLLLACQAYAADAEPFVRAEGEGEARAEPFVAAVRIDVERLRTDVLEDHFSPLGLRVTVVNESEPRFWSEPIAAGLDPLRVEPSPQFIGTQRRNLAIRVAAYLLVTAAFVAALGVMIAKFIRLVRREVALSRLKANFVADVSHELKTPLALIRMFSEMLGDDRVPSEQKKHEYYAIITRETSRLTHMIDNILDFSRLDAGKKDFTFQAIDVAAVVRDTYEAYRFDLDRHRFEHRLVVADGLPQVHADANAISQAIINLISNAIKYSTDEKALVIELSRETRRGKHGVLICVSDSGIGIKPEDRSHLFDGFYRAEDDRVRQQRGAGLGLSLVKSIVDAHGGIIDVESRLIKGTTFRIFLPQSSPASEPR